MRDPDGFIYYKEEVGGLVMGGFEPEAKPWRVDPIPSTFQFQLLDEDWDQFEILMTNAIHRTPCLETAQIKMLLNGPESFTPDGNFILGEAPELAQLLRLRRLQFRRHRQLRRRRPLDRRVDRRRRGAERLVGRRHPPLRLRSPPTASALAERTVETLGLHYAMRWPRAGAGDGAAAAPLAAVRPAATPRARVFGSKNGWERANYFLPGGRAAAAYTSRHAGLAALGARRAARDAAKRWRLRPDLVLQVAAAGPRCAGACCSACAPTRSTCRSAGWSTPRC